MAKRDFYEVLQVDKGADEATIKKSYRKLVRELHPDANPDDPQAADKFKEVKEAYDVLSDPQKKAMYDRYGMAAFDNQNASAGGARQGGGYSTQSGGFGGFGDFGMPFEDLFESFMGGSRTSAAQRRQMPQRGADHLYNMQIKFEESFTGVKKDVEITRSENCPTCSGSGAAAGTKPETCSHCKGSGTVRSVRQTILGNIATQAPCDVCGGSGQVIRTPCGECGGSGKVRKRRKVAVPIPAGVEDGMRLRMNGEGDPGERGGPPGDLYIQIQVKPHELFKRSGNDLTLELPITFVQAALGAEIEVPTLEGTTTLKIPEGTETGSILRQRDKGFPAPNGYGRGDFKVTVKIETPKKLSDAQREALLAFAATMGEERHSPQGKGIFEKVREVFRGES